MSSCYLSNILLLESAVSVFLTLGKSVFTAKTSLIMSFNTNNNILHWIKKPQHLNFMVWNVKDNQFVYTMLKEQILSLINQMAPDDPHFKHGFPVFLFTFTWIPCEKTLFGYGYKSL